MSKSQRENQWKSVKGVINKAKPTQLNNSRRKPSVNADQKFTGGTLIEREQLYESRGRSKGTGNLHLPLLQDYAAAQ